MHKPLLVSDFLDRARKYYGEMEAVAATSGERFTYNEFGERVDKFSSLLQNRGVRKGGVVAVVDPNTHENTFQDHPGVSEVTVIPVPSDQWGETPKAFVITEEGTDPAEDELIGYARDRLAGYKIPSEIEFVQSLPTSGTGKVKKHLLREEEWSDQDRLVGQQ